MPVASVVPLQVSWPSRVSVTGSPTMGALVTVSVRTPIAVKASEKSLVHVGPFSSDWHFTWREVGSVTVATTGGVTEAEVS